MPPHSTGPASPVGAQHITASITNLAACVIPDDAIGLQQCLSRSGVLGVLVAPAHGSALVSCCRLTLIVFVVRQVYTCVALSVLINMPAGSI